MRAPSSIAARHYTHKPMDFAFGIYRDPMQRLPRIGRCAEEDNDALNQMYGNNAMKGSEQITRIVEKCKRKKLRFSGVMTHSASICKESQNVVRVVVTPKGECSISVSCSEEHNDMRAALALLERLDRVRRIKQKKATGDAPGTP